MSCLMGSFDMHHETRRALNSGRSFCKCRCLTGMATDAELHSAVASVHQCSVFTSCLSYQAVGLRSDSNLWGHVGLPFEYPGDLDLFLLPNVYARMLTEGVAPEKWSAGKIKLLEQQNGQTAFAIDNPLGNIDLYGTGISLVDVNGDGKTDVVCGGKHHLEVFLQDKDGQLKESSKSEVALASIPTKTRLKGCTIPGHCRASLLHGRSFQGRSETYQPWKSLFSASPKEKHWADGGKSN